MFSGLIQMLGQIHDYQLDNTGSARLTLTVDRTDIPTHQFKLGASIAVNGTCLTLAQLSASGDISHLVFDLSPETIKRTTAQYWQSFSSDTRGKQLVNLETSLRMGDELGGHFVSGHVDGLGEISALTKGAGAWQLTIKLPRDLMPMMVTKGSVAIDGCSLTINGVDDDSIAITLIPHTIEHTIAQNYFVGQKVNVEIDMLMRYVANLVKK